MHDVAVLASQESREKVSSVDVLQEVPNITMQSTAEDTQALGVGVDRVVATTVNAADAPPLCHSWVGLSCTRGPLECQRLQWGGIPEGQQLSQESPTPWFGVWTVPLGFTAYRWPGAA